MQPYEGRLLVPGEEPLEGTMLVMAVGNNRLAGGGFEVAPLARMDDGLLDLAIVQNLEVKDVAKLGAELKKPGDPANKHLYYRQLAQFTLESSRGVHFNFDGEPTLKSTLKFTVLPKHLGVVF